MAIRKKNRPDSRPKGPYYFPQGAVGQVDRSLLPTSSIDYFEDVDIVNPQSGDYFRYDGTSWTNEPISQVLTDLKTVDGSGSGLDADLLDSYEASAFPRKLETATIPGQWTFTQDPYVSNGAYTGYINFDSASEAADHNAVFLLRDSGGQPIWRFYKRTDKNLALMRGSGPTMVWEADVTTGKMDFNQIPTVDGVDIMRVGDPPTSHTHTESEITDGKYRLFRRDGFVAMTARETLHLTGGNQIDITATDDAGNDETDITIALNEVGLNADTLDTYHASAFPRITNNETITGTWTFDKVITLNGATTGQKKILFDAADLSFDRNMGFEFSHGGTGYLHKSVIQGTTGDFIWQSYDSSWKNIFEVKIASGTVDFNERPTHDGSQLALLSEVGDSYYSTVRRDGFTTMNQRTGMHWIVSAPLSLALQDDLAGDETEATLTFDGLNLGDLENVSQTAYNDWLLLRYNVSQSQWEQTSIATMLGQASVDDLSDVNTSGVSNGNVLTWNNTQGYFEATPPNAAFIRNDEVYSLISPSDGDVLTWDGTNSRWDATPPPGGTIYYQYIARNGFTAMTQRSLLRLIAGTNVTLSQNDDSINDETEITFAVTGGSGSGLDADKLDTYHATSFPRKSEAATISGAWEFTDQVTIDGGSTGDTRLIFDEINLSFERDAGLHWMHSGTTDLWKTALNADGDLLWYSHDGVGWDLTMQLDRSGQILWANRMYVGDTPAAPGLDIVGSTIPYIASDATLGLRCATASRGYLQYGTTNILSWASGEVTIGTSTTADLKIHEPVAGQWTVEALSTNDLNLKGTEVWIDDGGTNKARAASVKTITSSTTTPTGDYPYGTLHLIY